MRNGRLRVVHAGGVFPADTSVFAALSDRVELVVYGSDHALDWLTYAPRPPVECPSRTFPRLLPTTRGAHMLWLYRGMGAALTEDRPDVVHVVSEPWGLLSQQASTWVRRRDAALVLHGCDRIWRQGTAPERAAKRVLARRALRRADAYVAESPEAAEQARRHGLSPGALTASVHENPRDPERFRPARDSRERAEARRALGLPVEGAAIGFVGRLVPEKGALLFLDALRRLAPGGWWFALAGSGPEESVVAERAEAQGGHFLGELGYPDDVSLFCRAVDVLAVPSYRTPDWDDQSPRVVVEGMMSGCVVVGSRSGAIPRMVGDAGIVVAEHDVDDLARGLATALIAARDPGVRHRARAHAISTYSGSAVADRLVAVWQAAASRRRTA